jgi:predicted adenylyl cyclase CyaB
LLFWNENNPNLLSKSYLYEINNTKAADKMSMEIELKARITNYEPVKRLLSEKAEYLGAFEKDDTLWYPETPDSGEAAGLPPRWIRVRREKRSLPDGTEASAVFATYKYRKTTDGIEINDEREFEVRSSGQPDQVFEDFLLRMGLRPGAGKRKRGWAFSREGITAELAEAEGLGWFIELEILADNDREETAAEAKRRLLSFLDHLGIGREAIEARTYMQMLQERPNG